MAKSNEFNKNRMYVWYIQLILHTSYIIISFINLYTDIKTLAAI